MHVNKVNVQINKILSCFIMTNELLQSSIRKLDLLHLKHSNQSRSGTPLICSLRVFLCV